jgi:hypothetical protein
MKKIYLFILIVILAISDIVLINSSLFLGFFVTNKYLVDVDQEVYQQNIWSGIIIWLISSAIFRLYTLRTIKSFSNIYKASIQSIALFSVLFSSYLSVLSAGSFPGIFLATLFTILALSFVLSRFTSKMLEELFPFKKRARTQDEVDVVRFRSHAH